MSTTTNSTTQPAIIGGVVMGVLSALPIIAAGNLCCCLWMVSGGLVAAYVLQQNQPGPIRNGDGAFAGLLAGVAGAFVYLIVSIPIALLVAPMEKAVFQRLLDTAGSMPPEFRQFVDTYAGRGGSLSLAVHAARLTAGFVLMLFLGAIFSTLGGLLGAVIFRKPLPAASDQPTSS